MNSTDRESRAGERDLVKNAEMQDGNVGILDHCHFQPLRLARETNRRKNRKYLDYHKILLRMVDVGPWNRVIPSPVHLYP